jgi:hypothetical protein
MWNDAQQDGNIPRLTAMLTHEGFIDSMLYRQCLQYMKHVLNGDLGHEYAPHFGPPSRLIDTEPLMLPAISEAVQQLKEEGGPLTQIHLYTTDLPGPDNRLPFNFWNGIVNMQKDHPERVHSLVLHTVAPISGGAAAIADSCHLDVSQVVLEPFLPVNPAFYEGGFPRPGTAAHILVKAQLPEEEAFLGAASKSFAIAAADKVVLVMLGSQPTIKAMHRYLDQAAMMQQPPVSSKCWIFFACGSHEGPAYKDLYIALSTKSAVLNAQQQNNSLGLHFIPFTAQPAQAIEGRAEVTVTRSGGLTAGELLALAARGDKKQVLLHIEEEPHIPPKPPCCDQSTLHTWERTALKNGMVEWEAGNAEYLMKKVGAQLVTPRTFASQVNLTASPSPMLASDAAKTAMPHKISQ